MTARADTAVRLRRLLAILAWLAQVGEASTGLLESLARSIPMRRIGQPDEVAAMVVFLAGDDASYVTGQTVSVNGGLTMS